MKTKQIRNIYEQILDLPRYKLVYIMNASDEMLAAAFYTIKRYGIEPNLDVFEIFYDLVNEKLSGSPDIDHEFTENEYTRLMNIKKSLEVSDVKNEQL